MNIVHKLFNTKASSIDDQSKSVTFIISTNEPDRYGDVVDQKSWDFKAYQDNPLVLWGHDPSEPENVLGQATDLKVATDGSQTTAQLSFATDINPKAAMVFDMIKRGVLRTVSVGFRNHSLEYDEDTPILKDNELLEISVVPIPANAGAVAKELKAGNLHEKDARWLLDSMRKEVELLDSQLKASNHKEKSMTDEQATALIDSIAKLTTTVEELKTDNASLKEEIAALKPAEETADEKAAREAKEQEEANVAAGLNPDGSAKSGDDDQDGAEGDEFGDDTELTPEQEAELDAQLEETLAELEPAA